MEQSSLALGSYVCKRKVDDIDELERPELEDFRCSGCDRGACRPCGIYGYDPSDFVLTQCQVCKDGRYCKDCCGKKEIRYCDICAFYFCRECKQQSSTCAPLATAATTPAKCAWHGK